jgi:hypothetical protein
MDVLRVGEHVRRVGRWAYNSESGAYGLYGDPDGYDRNGAWDGFQVTSDAEGGL